MPFNKLRNLNLSLRLKRGPWRFWSWLREHGLAQVGIKVSEDNDWKDQQKLDKELWGCLLAAGIFWSTKRWRERSCLARQQCLEFFKSLSGTSASPSVLLDIGDNDPDEQPKYKRKCRLLKLSFISYFLETFVSTALTLTWLQSFRFLSAGTRRNPSVFSSN